MQKPFTKKPEPFRLNDLIEDAFIESLEGAETSAEETAYFNLADKVRTAVNTALTSDKPLSLQTINEVWSTIEGSEEFKALPKSGDASFFRRKFDQIVFAIAGGPKLLRLTTVKEIDKQHRLGNESVDYYLSELDKVTSAKEVKELAEYVTDQATKPELLVKIGDHTKLSLRPELRLKAYQKAAEDLKEEGLSENEKTARTWQYLGQQFKDLNAVDDMAEAYEFAAKKYPSGNGTPRSCLTMADDLSEKGAESAAIKAVLIQAEQKSTGAEIRFEIAEKMRKNSFAAEALPVYLKVLGDTREKGRLDTLFAMAKEMMKRGHSEYKKMAIAAADKLIPMQEKAEDAFLIGEDLKDVDQEKAEAAFVCCAELQDSIGDLQTMTDRIDRDRYAEVFDAIFSRATELISVENFDALCAFATHIKSRWGDIKRIEDLLQAALPLADSTEAKLTIGHAALECTVYSVAEKSYGQVLDAESVSDEDAQAIFEKRGELTYFAEGPRLVEKAAEIMLDNVAEAMEATRIANRLRALDEQIFASSIERAHGIAIEKGNQLVLIQQFIREEGESQPKLTQAALKKAIEIAEKFSDLHNIVGLANGSEDEEMWTALFEKMERVAEDTSQKRDLLEVMESKIKIMPGIAKEIHELKKAIIAEEDDLTILVAFLEAHCERDLKLVQPGLNRLKENAKSHLSLLIDFAEIFKEGSLQALAKDALRHCAESTDDADQKLSVAERALAMDFLPVAGSIAMTELRKGKLTAEQIKAFYEFGRKINKAKSADSSVMREAAKLMTDCEEGIEEDFLFTVASQLAEFGRVATARVAKIYRKLIDECDDDQKLAGWILDHPLHEYKNSFDLAFARLKMSDEITYDDWLALADKNEIHKHYPEKAKAAAEKALSALRKEDSFDERKWGQLLELAQKRELQAIEAQLYLMFIEAADEADLGELPILEDYLGKAKALGVADEAITSSGEKIKLMQRSKLELEIAETEAWDMLILIQQNASEQFEDDHLAEVALQKAVDNAPDFEAAFGIAQANQETFKQIAIQAYVKAEAMLWDGKKLSEESRTKIQEIIQRLRALDASNEARAISTRFVRYGLVEQLEKGDYASVVERAGKLGRDFADLLIKGLVGRAESSRDLDLLNNTKAELERLGAQDEADKIVTKINKLEPRVVELRVINNGDDQPAAEEKAKPYHALFHGSRPEKGSTSLFSSAMGRMRSFIKEKREVIGNIKRRLKTAGDKVAKDQKMKSNLEIRKHEERIAKLEKMIQLIEDSKNAAYFEHNNAIVDDKRNKLFVVDFKPSPSGIVLAVQERDRNNGDVIGTVEYTLGMGVSEPQKMNYSRGRPVDLSTIFKLLSGEIKWWPKNRSIDPDAFELAEAQQKEMVPEELKIDRQEVAHFDQGEIDIAFTGGYLSTNDIFNVLEISINGEEFAEVENIDEKGRMGADGQKELVMQLPVPSLVRLRILDIDEYERGETEPLLIQLPTPELHPDFSATEIPFLEARIQVGFKLHPNTHAVEWSKDSGLTWERDDKLTGFDREKGVYLLNPKARYQLKVRAIAKVGDLEFKTPASETISITSRRNASRRRHGSGMLKPAAPSKTDDDERVGALEDKKELRTSGEPKKRRYSKVEGRSDEYDEEEGIFDGVEDDGDWGDVEPSFVQVLKKGAKSLGQSVMFRLPKRKKPKEAIEYLKESPLRLSYYPMDRIIKGEVPEDYEVLKLKLEGFQGDNIDGQTIEFEKEHFHHLKVRVGSEWSGRMQFTLTILREGREEEYVSTVPID